MNPLPTIPDHTLLRPIGRGSYGEVWLARNVMGAPRAVKIIWRRQFDSDRPYEREFAGIQRYEPVSRSADGLVHVLHVGRNDAEGYFYYVMELADDVNAECQTASEHDQHKTDTTHLVAYQPRTLRNDLQRLQRLPIADCLRFGPEICAGLAQLHRQGLVHRDVKPGNIIFVHGRAKLADIGLVSAGGEGRTFVGTEGYIPPEGPGSPSADLYALGIVLYEAATGFGPERFPDAPAEWFRDDETDDALELHEVILKACESRRENRYETAEAMHADLALLQSGQSVRRVRALEARALWARRVGWAAVIVAAIAVVAFLFADWRARLAEQTSAQQAALRRRAEAAEQDARQKLYDAYLAEARGTVLSGEAGRRFQALEAIRRAAAVKATPELRRAAFAAMELVDWRPQSRLVLPPKTPVATLDPGFTRYVTAVPRGDVQIYSFADQQLLQTLPASTTNRSANVFRFSTDGRYLAFKRDAAGGETAHLEVWDLVNTQRVIMARDAVTRTALAFHPYLPRLLAGRPSGRLVVWDVERGAELTSWRLPQQWAVAYAPEGNRFAVSYDDDTRRGIVEVRDATDGTVITKVPFPKTIRALSWHPRGQLLGVPSGDGTVSLMDARDGTALVLGKHKAQAVSVEFSPDGEFLLSGGWDSELNVWNVASQKRELTGAIGASIFHIAPDNGRIAFSRDGTLHIFEFVRGECLNLGDDLHLARRFGRFSPDGRVLAMAMNTGVGVWDLTHPHPQMATEGDQGLGHLDFSPQSDELFGNSDASLFRWRMEAGDASNAPPRVESLDASKTKSHIDSAHLLWRNKLMLTTGERGIYLAPITNSITAAGIRIPRPCWRAGVSADESRVAVAFGNGFTRQPFLCIYDLPHLTRERWITNTAPVRGLALSPDGKNLVVVTDAELCLWDSLDGRVKKRVPIATDVFSRVEYSADGRTIIFSENARASSLLDGGTLDPLLPLPTWSHAAALSSNNRQLAVVVEGQRLQVWNLPALRARFRELGIDWQ